MTINICNKRFHDIIKTSNLEKTTQDTYIKQLNMWLRYSPCLSDIINNPDTYVEALGKSGIEESSKWAMLKAIIALLKHSGLKDSHPSVYNKWYHDHFDKSNTAVKEKWQEFTPSQKTLESAMTWKDIIAKYNKISREKPYSLEHLTLALYTIIPPRRQRDYYRLAVIREKDKMDEVKRSPGVSGYLDLTISPAVLVVLTYKTKKLYKEWKKELPLPLDKIVRKYLERRPKAKYLFEKLDGEPYPSHDSFTVCNNRILKRVLENENASVNVLRHAASTYVYYNTSMSPLEKQQYAFDMGHSVITQSHYVVTKHHLSV